MSLPEGFRQNFAGRIGGRLRSSNTIGHIPQAPAGNGIFDIIRVDGYYLIWVEMRRTCREQVQHILLDQENEPLELILISHGEVHAVATWCELQAAIEAVGAAWRGRLGERHSPPNLPRVVLLCLFPKGGQSRWNRAVGPDFPGPAQRPATWIETSRAASPVSTRRLRGPVPI
jgi:hypothetical protein